MFYETATNRHGLPHDPFKAIVSPRPIGWIGTCAMDGSLNLAPYSFFNAISDRPKLVMFSSSGYKDSVRNIEATGEFTASFASRNLSEAVNRTSLAAPHGESEFEIAGLTPVEGTLVRAPFVGEAFAALECRMTEMFQPKGLDGVESDSYVVIGAVVGIHIRDEAIRDGRFDVTTVKPLARLGYMDYCDGGDVFEMTRPFR
ncbi:MULTISPECIES: flavin reductase family protein [Sinorhizobium]|uniref:Flavin reductase n=2 Tax=Sinorhizobium TaxID=28105 RepID=A0A2S3YW50_9HYPH|nr:MULTISPECIES: flavin reductase family protein [Sinorhizobium]ASY56151.1 Nitrilotriacetate monooxygenase component B [Sinorhizobium sp. CCBAU 05631]AUX76076.1 flavin reductase-like protein [Sinorhizobium fredii]PDT39937.1 flavin reductase family protein [Sinorhizobium sp. FG01]PDT55284.1 flavin reductase family protein [Sinorhizobium sp. NG07B]POH32321.1 flavin reductase [Sinorhizobium americanum]